MADQASRLAAIAAKQTDARDYGSDGHDNKPIRKDSSRKSRRIAETARVNYRESTSESEERSPGRHSPSKKVKSTSLTGGIKYGTWLTDQDKSVGTSSEFQTNGSLHKNDVHKNDVGDLDYVPSPQVAASGKSMRRAAGVARQRIATQHVSPKKGPPEKSLSKDPKEGISPEIMEAARTYGKRFPAKLEPHFLSRTRIVIDSLNVALYAEHGATDPWKSAYSAYRYNGPRKHAPFRELHRLSDPSEDDISDWAENIRWAKQQYKLYGSVWTEYGYSLECITEHRIRSLWVSEELIRSGRYPPN